MSSRSKSLLYITALALVLLVMGYLFAERWLKALLLYLSTAVWAQNLISKTRLARLVASRFIAGETVDDAIETTRILNSKGMAVTVNYLGEHVHSAEKALFAKAEILRLLDSIAANRVEANVSVKPSQLGLQIDPDLLYQNLFEVVTHAKKTNNRIRIDMEESDTVDTTLGIYRRLRDEDNFGNHVGVVIQAYLYRSQADIQKLADEGAWVRLCKGAYAEPESRAFPEKADTDHNFVKLSKMMLSQQARAQGAAVALATHDENMIQAIIGFARKKNIPAEAFEFQMLFGIRRELQTQLVAQGYRMRIYIPYGTAWYPYFVRRLAERPANLWFFISNLLRR